MALASPFQHILHLLFKTFLTLSKGDVKKWKIFLCGYSFPCPHIKICWNGGVQPFSLEMGIDHACFRSSRAVTALSTFWVDILPPWGTLSDRSVTEIAIASPSNETEHCLMLLLHICAFTCSQRILTEMAYLHVRFIFGLKVLCTQMFRWKEFTEVSVLRSCGILPFDPRPCGNRSRWWWSANNGWSMMLTSPDHHKCYFMQVMLSQPLRSNISPTSLIKECNWGTWEFFVLFRSWRYAFPDKGPGDVWPLINMQSTTNVIGCEAGN